MTRRRDPTEDLLRELAPQALGAVARHFGDFDAAEDAVQETWLRLSRSGDDGIDNLGGWLTTVAGRVCLNRLRTRRRRPTEPLEVHVPDPLVGVEDGLDPEHQALLADSVRSVRLVDVARGTAPAHDAQSAAHAS